MFSRRSMVAVMAAGSAVASVAGALPAYALTSLTVSAGSAPSGTSVAFQGVSGTVTFTFGTNGKLTCTSSRLTGTTKAGANSPSNLAQINGGAGQLTFTNCTSASLPATIDGVGTAKWTVAATGNSASGTTPINITGINLAVGSSSCTFNITGSVAGTFVNGNPSKIAVQSTTSSQLVVSNFVLAGGATKCLGGAVTNTSPGNRVGLAVTWNVTATNGAYNPVTAIAS